eukprot:5601848-Prymnesium_polylepis.1
MEAGRSASVAWWLRHSRMDVDATAAAAALATDRGAPPPLSPQGGRERGWAVRDVDVDVWRAAVVRRLEHGRVAAAQKLGHFREDGVMLVARAALGQVDERDGLCL